MPDIEWTDPVVVIAVVLAYGLYCTVRSFVARPSLKESQRWLEGHVGGSSPRLVQQLAPLLRSRDQARSLGALTGAGIGTAVYLVGEPRFDYVWYAPVMLGALAGALVAVGTHTVVQVGRTAPPAGVRVAASTRTQTAWFVSRPALAAYVLAAALQIATVAVGVATGPEPRLADAVFVDADVLIVAGCAFAGARYISWLLARPLHASDEYELRTAIAWRRDQIDDVVDVSFSLLLYASMLGSVALRYDSPWMMPMIMATVALAAVGLSLQSWQMSVNGPVRAVPPTRLSDTYVPAPGTNGWVFSRHAR